MILLVSQAYSQQSKEVFNLGIEASKRGDYKLADSLFLKSIQYGRSTNAITFENYYNCGVVKRELNQINLAIMYFDSSIFMKPNHFASYYDRSICYYWNEDYKGCIKSIDEGLKIKEQNVDIFVLGAMASLADSSYQKGFIYCSRGKLVRKDSRFYGIQALLLLQQNEFEKQKRK